MNPGDPAVLILTLLGGGGGIAALIKVIHDWRSGISTNERQARQEAAEDRRDTIADRDGLIERLERRLEAVEQRLTAAEDGNVAKALVIRRQGDHIDVLEDWIWKGRQPPPPPRPEGV